MLEANTWLKTKTGIPRIYRSGVIFFVSFFLQSCTSVFFQPDNIDYSKYWSFTPEISEIRIKSPDGLEMTHWLIHADSSAKKPTKGTLFFLHGNGQNNSAYVPLVQWLSGHGYNIFMFEYRGYGKNQARLSLELTISDIETALDYLLSRSDIGPVSLYGQSLGASITAYIASNYHQKASFCAVVLEAPFSGYRNIVREKFSATWLTWPFQYPFSWLYQDKYSPDEEVHKIAPVPLMVIHGHSDRVVPAHHGKRLFDLANEPKRFLSVNGFHIQAMANPQVQFALLSFLEEYGC